MTEYHNHRVVLLSDKSTDQGSNKASAMSQHRPNISGGQMQIRIENMSKDNINHDESSDRLNDPNDSIIMNSTLTKKSHRGIKKSAIAVLTNADSQDTGIEALLSSRQ